MAGFDLSDYIGVAERISKFYAAHPDGRIVCDPPKAIRNGEADITHVEVTVRVYRTVDDPCPCQASAWEPYPGTTPYTKGSEMMNAETAAAGRAVIMAGIPSGRSMASREEIQNRQPDRPGEQPVDRISPQQLAALMARLKALPDDVADRARVLVKQGPHLEDLPAGDTDEAFAFVELCEAET